MSREYQTNQQNGYVYRCKNSPNGPKRNHYEDCKGHTKTRGHWNHIRTVYLPRCSYFQHQWKPGSQVEENPNIGEEATNRKIQGKSVDNYEQLMYLNKKVLNNLLHEAYLLILSE